MLNLEKNPPYSFFRIEFFTEISNIFIFLVVFYKNTF
nr:MAG TPA: hypothetical protein [Caudoviricetes sp.]